MYTRDSKYSDYITEIEPFACKAAVEWGKAASKLTFGQTMDLYLTDKEANQSWAVWSLQAMGDKLDNDLRTGFIAKITDPMMAFHLYLKTTITTVPQDRLLEAKFQGKLPRAERQLADGTIQREKDKAQK